MVCLFTAALPYLAPPKIIETVRNAFPDCEVRELLGDKLNMLRLEFELYGRHFIEHRHPFDGCNGIVCWIDDYHRWPEEFRVIELCDSVKDSCPWLIEDADNRDSKAPWERRTFFERAAAERTSPVDIDRIERILEFAEEHRLGPNWLVNPVAVFAVGEDDQFFKVYSTGHIGFPFCRLDCSGLFPELVARLNPTLQSPIFAVADAQSKSKHGLLSQLWPDPGRFEESLEVWKWFGTARGHS